MTQGYADGGGNEWHVDGGGTEWHQTNRGVSIYIAIYLTIFIIVAYFGKLLHDYPKVGSVLPEAAMIIIVGMVVGFFIHLVAGDDDDEAMADDVARSMLSFSPTVFFVVLLPPIIFNSGYHLRRDLFFRYITPICLYACLGTVICTVAVAALLYAASPLFSFEPTVLELLAFGALISATDPVSTLAVFSAKRVDPHLFYLVFGESVINDAVGLVLFEALAHLIESSNEGQLDVGEEVLQFLFDFALGFVGSMALGTLFAICVALFLKNVDMRHTPLLELSVYVIIMYFSFCIAEIARLSGIVTVLFTGIVARRYAAPNLSLGTAANADQIFRLTAHFTETLIFIELGLSVADLAMGYDAFHPGFIGAALLACLIGRAVNIYPLTALINCMAKDDEESKRVSSEFDVSEGGYALEVDAGNGQEPPFPGEMIQDSRISMNKAHMLWFSGLRGAVSYALCKTFPNVTGNQSVFIITTALIVLVTTFLFGGCTECALTSLRIPMGVDEAEYMRSIQRRQFLKGWLHDFEEKKLRRWLIRDFDKQKQQNEDGSGSKQQQGREQPFRDDIQPTDSGGGGGGGDYSADEEMIELELQEYLKARKKHMIGEVLHALYDYGQ